MEVAQRLTVHRIAWCVTWRFPSWVSGLCGACANVSRVDFLYYQIYVFCALLSIFVWLCQIVKNRKNENAKVAYRTSKLHAFALVS